MEAANEFTTLIASLCHAPFPQIPQRSWPDGSLCSPPGGPNDLVDSGFAQAREVAPSFGNVRKILESEPPIPAHEPIPNKLHLFRRRTNARDAAGLRNTSRFILGQSTDVTSSRSNRSILPSGNNILKHSPSNVDVGTCSWVLSAISRSHSSAGFGPGLSPAYQTDQNTFLKTESGICSIPLSVIGTGQCNPPPTSTRS